MNEFQKEVLAYLNNIEDRLIRIEPMIAGLQRFTYAVANSEYRRDMRTMADFSRLNEKVSKMTSIAESIKAMNDGLKTERDAAVAELAAVKAADQVDQAAVDAAEAKLAEVTAALEAITAVASGTPVVLPPDTGGSTGGNTEPTI